MTLPSVTSPTPPPSGTALLHPSVALLQQSFMADAPCWLTLQHFMTADAKFRCANLLTQWCGIAAVSKSRWEHQYCSFFRLTDWISNTWQMQMPSLDVQVHSHDDRGAHKGAGDQAAGVVHAWRGGGGQDHAHGSAGPLRPFCLSGLPLLLGPPSPKWHRACCYVSPPLSCAVPPQPARTRLASHLLPSIFRLSKCLHQAWTGLLSTHTFMTSCSD